ncbi:MAG: hypothetical protein ACJATV_000804 [Granulosicoccus sp.]|jgi:hypothetical protein
MADLQEQNLACSFDVPTVHGVVTANKKLWRVTKTRHVFFAFPVSCILLTVSYGPFSSENFK